MKTPFALLALTLSAVAADIRLAWDPAPDAASYKVYAGTNSRTYTIVTNVPSAGTNTIGGLQTGVLYFFAVTALSTNALGLESEFSNEVSSTPRPGGPVLRIVTTVQTASTPTGPWQEVTNFVASVEPHEPEGPVFVRSYLRVE